MHNSFVAQLEAAAADVLAFAKKQGDVPEDFVISVEAYTSFWRTLSENTSPGVADCLFDLWHATRSRSGVLPHTEQPTQTKSGLGEVGDVA